MYGYCSEHKPKLSLFFSSVEILRDQALEAWKFCPRKKLVAATAVTMCWNLLSVKTRVMAGTYAEMIDTFEITYYVNLFSYNAVFMKIIFIH